MGGKREVVIGHFKKTSGIPIAAVAVTYKDLSLLNSCTKPGAQCKQSVDEGPVQPRQLSAQG